ncbi:MAG: hypothetical protein PUF03_01950 [Lachnospiraceae bacterium]|nr:hypothetical protein [Lachnospiraceae bacterium]
MTLEASFVLPFFLFAVINILSAVNIIGAQSRINAALHQVGNKMAFAGYAYEHSIGSSLPDSLSGVALTEGYAKGQIIKYVGSSYLEQSCIVSGAGGMSMAGSSVMGTGDVIDLQVSYQVKPLIAAMGFNQFSMTQRYYGKAWTGYDVTQWVSDTYEEDPMVFITETGTVYHLDRNCVYLNPSIEIIDADSVENRRNQDGGKYYPCEKCGTKTGGREIYITSQGNRYHTQLNCSGLKRTIYTVPLSQTGGRGRCSKCG